MGLMKTIWATPVEHLRHATPQQPMLYFAPMVLQATARDFIERFPGLVTYAVKSNPSQSVLSNLIAAGIFGFDVASPAEMELIARTAPGAAMHYNNPVRARHEIVTAVQLGVRSYSVDSHSELDKLIELVPPHGTEISVRFKLPVDGAAYNFGAKFGATAEIATELLRRVKAAGFAPALTFHPGTQCLDPMAWDAYIRKAGVIAAAAGVAIGRLNVGGGFPSYRLDAVKPDLDAIFTTIDRVTGEVFGSARPVLVCEPGRALVAESFALAVQIKAIRDGEHVFMNDGVYGAMDELPLVGIIDRITALSPEGKRRTGAPRPRICFGPTCDSVDRLPGDVTLPADLQEGDYLLFRGFGAYSCATATRFNGYGNLGLETVYRFDN